MYVANDFIHSNFLRRDFEEVKDSIQQMKSMFHSLTQIQENEPVSFSQKDYVFYLPNSFKPLKHINNLLRMFKGDNVESILEIIKEIEGRLLLTLCSADKTVNTRGEEDLSPTEISEWEEKAKEFLKEIDEWETEVKASKLGIEHLVDYYSKNAKGKEKVALEDFRHFPEFTEEGIETLKSHLFDKWRRMGPSPVRRDRSPSNNQEAQEPPQPQQAR